MYLARLAQRLVDIEEDDRVLDRTLLEWGVDCGGGGHGEVLRDDGGDGFEGVDSAEGTSSGKKQLGVEKGAMYIYFMPRG